MDIKDPYLHSLLRSKQTVFSTTDVAIIWQENNRPNLNERLSYYASKNMLHRIRSGFYAKDKDYNRYEFATKLYSPSYIGLNTVLGLEGINFQYYSSIFIVSKVSRELKIDGQNYIYKKIKDEILVNTQGLKKMDYYYQASKERTILDVMYLYGDFYFDNLLGIDWDQCFELVKIYSKKSMVKRLNSYYKDFKEEYER